MAEATYKDLVAEAFLSPIRSVLIVDDDYPTLHEILLSDSERKRQYGDKDWNRSSHSRARVRRVIEQFRGPGAPYMLDIHDGRSPSEETDEKKVGTLQQTDLLILDYILDKAKEDDGTASLRIAREALDNKHFNLILVHTKEDLDDVFTEFALGLLQPCFEQDGNDDPYESLVDFLDEHETPLVTAVAAEQYLFARGILARKTMVQLKSALMRGEGPLGAVKTALETGGLDRREWLRALQYALEAFEGSNAERFSTENHGVLDWRNETVKYIRASRGFVCFSKKQDELDLLKTVHEALAAWRPLPSRLLLTKLRAEMNERGIEVQDDAIGNPEVGAVWYLRLLEKDEPGLQALIDRTVRHHSEQLLDQLLPQVNDFAARLRKIDAEKDAYDVVKRRFGLDLSNEAVLLTAKAGHNAFIGSKPSKSAHVDLGHILLIGGTYWFCATPACDMVPGQDRGSPPDKLPELKRFTALKLIEHGENKALRDANRGGQVFVNLRNGEGTERKAFRVAESLGSSPTSMTMYVENNGYLSEGLPPFCRVVHVGAETKPDGTMAPALVEQTALVCGMLRYEYALEIQSRYVASQARIGLEFEAHEPQAAEEKSD